MITRDVLLDAALAYIAHLDAPQREHEDGDGCYATFERAATEARQVRAESEAQVDEAVALLKMCHAQITESGAQTTTLREAALRYANEHPCLVRSHDGRCTAEHDLRAALEGSTS